MDDLDRSDLLHCTIGRGAIGAIYSLSRGGVHGFDERYALNVLKSWAAEAFEVESAVGLIEEDASTSLGRITSW